MKYQKTATFTINFGATTAKSCGMRDYMLWKILFWTSSSNKTIPEFNQPLVMEKLQLGWYLVCLFSTDEKHTGMKTGLPIRELLYQLHMVALEDSEQLQVSYPSNYSHKNTSWTIWRSGSATQLMLLRVQCTNHNKYFLLKTGIKVLTG